MPSRSLTPAHGDAAPPSARAYPYLLVDVFTDRRFSGNPLAVFTDARGLNTEQMQQIARELNHPETTFVFPPLDETHDYSVRIFSPHAELPTAGHPTIGTAFAIAQDSQRKREESPERFVFEEVSGPVSVSFSTPITTTRQELPRFGAEYNEPHTAAAVLSLTAKDLLPDVPVQAVSSRMPYLIVPLRNLEALGRIQIREDIWNRTLRRFEAPHLYVFCMDSHSGSGVTTATARMFAPGLGVPEAPATESACGPLAAYLVRYRLVPVRTEHLFVFEQGGYIGRPSVIHVSAEQENGELTQLRVGGSCVIVGQGTLFV